MITTESISALKDLSDEELSSAISEVQFSVPWQYSESPSKKARVDEDGFKVGGSGGFFTAHDITSLQVECWNKFVSNPLANSSIRDTVGRLTGKGFGVTSEFPEIQEVIEEEWTDWRNRLYMMMSKFAARAEVEGELFLCLSVHKDSFIEIDFRDPGTVAGAGTQTGIIYHPRKTTLPLLYSFKGPNAKQELVPSIFVAYSPSILNDLPVDSYDANLLNESKDRDKKYKSLGGFKRFIVEWDKGYLTQRNISNLKTTIDWLNHYENLKKYEIDHKKSSGSYLWVAQMTDPKAFRTWISLTDDERAKTGLTAKKTPGGTIVIPPGVELKCVNPNLSRISDQDTDILEMAVAGLNKPKDHVTGSAKGTFASAKALSAPQSDRISDEIEYFDRFLRYDFWKPIFFLKNAVNSSFKIDYKIEEVVDFKGEENVKKKVKKKVWDLIDISYPVSEMTDTEAIARAMLGVKHGSVVDTLGLPRSVVAKKLGFGGNYRQYRLAHATENERYPELLPTVDAESYQEQTEAEPPRQEKKKEENTPSNADKNKQNSSGGGANQSRRVIRRKS